MKRLVKCNKKRGVVIESALFILLVVVMMGALLLSVSTITSKNQNSRYASLNGKIVIDKVAEDYLSNYINSTLSTWESQNQNYLADTELKENNILNLNLYEAKGKEKGNLLLSAEVIINSNQYVVIKWEY